MDSYHEPAFMDTLIKLLKVREEVTQLQVQKKKLQMKIDAKLQEAEISMRSSHFLKIISHTKGKCYPTFCLHRFHALCSPVGHMTV